MTANGETMADTEKDNTETVPDKVIVTNPEVGASNNRIEKMKKLTGRLRGQKGAMTREYKKLDEFITDFQQAGDNNFPATILQTKAQDLMASNDRMRKYRDELESISNELTLQMWESQENELGGISPDDAVAKVYEDVDSYVGKYKKTFRCKCTHHCQSH